MSLIQKQALGFEFRAEDESFKDRIVIFLLRLINSNYGKVTGNPVFDVTRDLEIIQKAKKLKPYLITFAVLAVSGTSYYIYTKIKK